MHPYRTYTCDELRMDHTGAPAGFADGDPEKRVVWDQRFVAVSNAARNRTGPYPGSVMLTSSPTVSIW